MILYAPSTTGALPTNALPNHCITTLLQPRPIPPTPYSVVMTATMTPPTPEGMTAHRTARLAPLIRLDLFPAIVKSPDNSVFFTHDKARVIVTTDALYIFTDSPNGPAVALKARLSSAHGDRRTGYTLTYLPPADETTTPPTPRSLVTLTVTPSDGCGCGSKLRAFTPFTPMRYTNPGPNLQ